MCIAHIEVYSFIGDLLYQKLQSESVESLSCGRLGDVSDTTNRQRFVRNLIS